MFYTTEVWKQTFHRRHLKQYLSLCNQEKNIIRVEYICGGGGSVSVSELAGNMVRPLVGQKLGTTIFRLALLKPLAIIKILSG